MNKFIQILKTSFRQEFAYKISFLMWRFRNIVQILVFFFLWGSVFSVQGQEIFNYTKEKIFAYAFVLIVVRAVVLSSRSIDVSGIISKGDLMNLLLKPVNFFKYWLTRDIGSKLLNLSFGVLEIGLLVLIFKPNIFVQSDIVYILFFILSVFIACFLYFTLLMIVNFAPFWMPEISWGAQFLFMVIFVEFLSGSFFPLDVFPSGIYKFLVVTPFPYLIFIPIKIYLGSFSITVSFQYLSIGLVWCLISWKLMKTIWNRGLLVYEGTGK